jgi:RHS repeat-associated protein
LNLNSSAGDLSPMHFTGKQHDPESGLDNFGARYYGSSDALGRFITPDWSPTASPVPYADFSDPQSLNQYAYVRNNPMSRADADGHDQAPKFAPAVSWDDLCDANLCNMEQMKETLVAHEERNQPDEGPYAYHIGPDPENPKKKIYVGDYPGEVAFCFGGTCEIWNATTRKWQTISANDPRAKDAQKNWTTCGDYMCNQQGQAAGLAPVVARALSEDVALEFMLAGAAAKGLAVADDLASSLRVKSGMHAAHHNFGWGLGRLPHYQINVWRAGVKGSDFAIRIPWPW